MFYGLSIYEKVCKVGGIQRKGKINSPLLFPFLCDIDMCIIFSLAFFFFFVGSVFLVVYHYPL
jgi:hypothetical protein